MSEDKLNLVKNFKFTTETLQLFESALKKLHEEPEETDVDATGTVTNLPISPNGKTDRHRITSTGNEHGSMKHSLALHMEHTLD